MSDRPIDGVQLDAMVSDKYEDTDTELEAGEPDSVKPELTELQAAILDMVTSLKPGEIMTYGEVAAEVGQPGAARAVGSTLRRHGSGVPWWRIVAANGRLVPGGEDRQRLKLAAEGVPVRNGRVAMQNLRP